MMYLAYFTFSIVYFLQQKSIIMLYRRQIAVKTLPAGDTGVNKWDRASLVCNMSRHSRPDTPHICLNVLPES